MLLLTKIDPTLLLPSDKEEYVSFAQVVGLNKGGESGSSSSLKLWRKDWVPFEEAAKFVVGLGMTKFEEWQQWASGHRQERLAARIPSNLGQCKFVRGTGVHN